MASPQVNSTTLKEKFADSLLLQKILFNTCILLLAKEWEMHFSNKIDKNSSAG